MFRNIVWSSLRNLWRNKLHTFINITSLTLGLTVFAFAFLYVKKELTYDRSWPDVERIHRLTIEQRGLPGSPDGVFNNVLARAWPTITEYFVEEIESATRIYVTTVKPADTEVTSYPFLAFADPGFTGVFKLETVQGNLDRAFEAPGYIALEESYAASLGAKGAMGESLELEFSSGRKISYQVAAIYRLPDNISNFMNFKLVTWAHDYSLQQLRVPENPEAEIAWQVSSQIWITLKPDVQTAAFNAMQPVFLDRVVTAYDQALGPDRKLSEHMFYNWQPITDMHFNPVSMESRSGGNSGNKLRVLTFAAAGILILLVGCSNSVSLSLASALERRREIGVRKAAGAMQGDIMLHYLGESVLLALLALVPALALFELFQPAFVNMLPFAMGTLDARISDYFLLFLIAVLTGIGSGVYPALVLASVKPEAVLKPGSGSGSSSRQRLRALLVAAQFCLASILLIGTSALYVQLALTRSQPLGFSGENKAAIFLRNEQTALGVALAEEFRKIPGVTNVLPGFGTPNQNMPLGPSSVTMVRKNDEVFEIKAQSIPTTPGMFDVYDMPVIAGRDYDSQRDMYDSETRSYDGVPAAAGSPLVLNRSAVKALGFSRVDEAIDQLVYRKFNMNTGEPREAPHRIVGVVEDSMYASLHRRPGPEMYSLVVMPVYVAMLLEYEDAVEASLLEKLHAVSREVTGYLPGQIEFSETVLDRAFRQERNESRLLLICAGLALFLACIGLFGLASFAVERNVKEVGIRKVLGSSVSSIMALFVWRFSRPVLLANLLAWPLAAWFVLEWIKQFPYQLEKIWLLPLCIGAAVLVLLIAILTVSVITARAAAAKPVQSLRYE